MFLDYHLQMERLRRYAANRNAVKLVKRGGKSFLSKIKSLFSRKGSA